MIKYAIKVRQPIGDFYLVSLSGERLHELCFAKPYERYRKDESGSVKNGPWYQRVFGKQRANPIGDYLKTQDAALPGTIVLAANYTEDGRFITDDNAEFESKKCWRVRKCSEALASDVLYELNIPDNIKSAMVVDGQHRLGGFVDQPDKVLAMEVPCAVFLDLPIPMQAYVFATINFNQKPVSKSLNYELFAFDIDNEKPISWSPDKLAVYLSRRLNADNGSPLRDHIKIGAVDCTGELPLKEWKVSTATIVNGILSLITKDSQGDRNRLDMVPASKRDRTLLIGYNCDLEKLPLRTLYIGYEDEFLYAVVKNYFIAMEVLLNKGNESFPVFHKTTGFVALFKVLKELIVDVFKKDSIDVSSAMWLELFCSQNKIVTFSGDLFKGSSASIAGHIANLLLMMAGARKLDDFRGKDCYDDYERLWDCATWVAD